MGCGPPTMLEAQALAVIAIVIWSITTHEVAHGWVALKCGDDTAKQMGRLTLNPLPHVDPFMTILMPGLLLMSGLPVLGGARPVPVMPGRFRRYRRDMALVAAAGPLSNILIGVVLAGILAAFVHSGFWAPDASGALVLGAAIWINFGLAAFNLFPLPPLDGSKIVGSFLTGEAAVAWRNLDRIGIWLLLGVLFFAPELLRGFVVPIMFFLAEYTAEPLGIVRSMNESINWLFGG